MAEPPVQEKPPEGRAPTDAWRRWWPARRVGAVTLVAGMLAAGGWVAWYAVRPGSAGNEASRDICATPAPRPAAPVTRVAQPRVPTTIRAAVPTATPTACPEWRGSQPVTGLLVGIAPAPERAEAGALP